MKNHILDNLVRLGSIADYQYSNVEGVNNQNQVSYFERLVIYFHNGEKLVLDTTCSAATENSELIIT